MTAVTPSFDASGLSALASRMLDIEAMPWEPTRFPGIEIKTLLKDTETGLLTTLVKMAPGARLPDHEHVDIEQTWILEGSLADHEGEVTAGNYVWRPAGSRHEAVVPGTGGCSSPSSASPTASTTPTAAPTSPARRTTTERGGGGYAERNPSSAKVLPRRPFPPRRPSSSAARSDLPVPVTLGSRGPPGQSSFGRTSWAKRSITSSALSAFSGTKSSVKCSAPISM